MDSEFLFVGMILVLTVVAPIWLTFHYITRWRSTKALTGEDQQLLQELYQSASKMEDRIHHLERILDEEAPAWRGRGADV